MVDKNKHDDIEPPDVPKRDDDTMSEFRNQLAHFSFDVPDISKYYADLLDATRLFDYSVVSKAIEQYTELQRSTAASLSSVLDSFKWLQAPSVMDPKNWTGY